MALSKEEKEKRKEERKRLKWEQEHKYIGGIDHKLCCVHNKYFLNEEPYFPATLEYFYKNVSNSRDGLSNKCIRCEIIRGGLWQKENPEQYKANNKRNNKINAESHKPYVREYNQKFRAEGKHIVYYQNNKERFSKYNRNRKEKNHNIYDKEWELCKQYFNYKCAYCGKPLNKNYITRNGKTKLFDFDREHVIFNGKDNLSNCVPSCLICNNEKKRESLNDWYNANNPNYTYERYYKIYQWMRYDYKKYIMPKRRYKGQHMTQRLKEIEKNKKIN
jgi:hypothetical protein